ncbi:hypothetical protein RR48_10613 [Papilio machaon]|uniref:Trichohyalin-plectin-homology domain-containing protein n=1 Tax=Papilio machaon TaxID=76193 RepID=A0A194RML3_PAPMA|nr:hypothetical protein RR48_10613 [Papilio machaon]
MNSRKYLILHKDEWERIKRQRNCEETTNNNGDMQRLQELSQEWIKSWPDTTKGHIELLKKIEARKRKKDIEEIKKFALQKKKDCSLEAIQKARQVIFEDSCYGKQLISCLIQSKTLEEREAQLKFKKNLKEKAIIDEKEEYLKEKQRNRELEKKKMEKMRQKQMKDREIAEINKTMYENQNTKVIRDKELQKQTELEDMKLIKNFLEIETKCRIQNTIVKKKDSSKKLQLFQTLEWIKRIEENKYNDFVDKGIKRLEQKLNEDKLKEIQKQNVDNKKNCSIKSMEARDKTQKKTNYREETKNMSKVCHCDRQTLFCKPSKKNYNNALNFNKEESLQFLMPSKSLEDELEKREKEPFPWSGTKAAHEQFAKEASKILGECRFKPMARKVVDEYIKINGLNNNNLPIKNYL